MTDRSCAGVRQLLIRLLALVIIFATVEALASCLAEWPQMARDHNATAWLTYMPSKQRALDPTCNPIWDTHLNETGPKVVARMLTDAMCGAAGRDKTQ